MKILKQARWWLIVIWAGGLAMGSPAQGQIETTAYIVYVTDGGGVSLLTFTSGTFSTPVPLLPATTPPSASYLALAPPGDYVSIIRRYENTADLTILAIPSGEALFTQPLLPANFQVPATPQLGDPPNELWQAIGEMAWSPDGDYLVFAGGYHGNTADLYVVDILSSDIQHLEMQPGAASLITWSPTGNWLVYSDLQTFGGEAGFLSQGIFALSMAALNNGQPIRLDLPAAYPNDVIRIGWRDAETLLISPRSFIAGARGLYSWHIPSNTIHAHLPDALEVTVPVYSPVSDSAAFIVPDLGANIPLMAGFYIQPLGRDTPVPLFAGTFYSVRLVNERFFQLTGENGELLLDALSLEETVLPAGEIATFVSPTAAYSVAYFSDAIQINHLDSTDTLHIPLRDALPPIWLNADYFVTYGVGPQGAGLFAVHIVSGAITLLDRDIMPNGPWRIATP